MAACERYGGSARVTDTRDTGGRRKRKRKMRVETPERPEWSVVCHVCERKQEAASIIIAISKKSTEDALSPLARFAPPLQHGTDEDSWGAVSRVARGAAWRRVLPAQSCGTMWEAASPGHLRAQKLSATITSNTMWTHSMGDADSWPRRPHHREPPPGHLQKSRQHL